MLSSLIVAHWDGKLKNSLYCFKTGELNGKRKNFPKLASFEGGGYLIAK